MAARASPPVSGGRALGRTAAQRKQEAVSKATRTEPPQLPRAAPGIPWTPPCDPRRTSRRPHLTAQGLRLSYLLWSRTAEAGPEPGAPGAPRPPAPRALGLESGARHSSAVGLQLQPGRLLGCGSWPPQQMPPGAWSLSPPCSRRPPQGWPCPRDGGQLRPPLEPWTHTRCRAEPVRRAQATPSHPAKPPPQSLRSRGRGRAGPEGHSMTHGPESHAHRRGPRGWRDGGVRQPWRLPVLPMDPGRSERTSVHSRDGDAGVGTLTTCPPRPQGEAGLTQEPSRWQQDSWTLQTKSLPFVWSRNSHLKRVSLEAPWAVGLGGGDPIPGCQVPAPGRPWARSRPHPVQGALAEQAVWEATSAEHQGRNGTRALSRGPHPRDATLQTTESGAAREALTWGTTWRARSRGRPLAPSSADPRSRRSTSLCPVGLWGAEMLPCPHPATPPGPACPPGWKQTGGSQVAFS